MSLGDKFNDAKDQAVEKGKDHLNENKDEYTEKGKDFAKEKGEDLKGKFGK
ncbi:hypothetical protein [Mammaliicoccus sp. Dog046]|uniref:hypothetical protein n=1 Tax=Mammaliicoccus sp. Dog046 TaxID=3034233 RepID=UPI002B2575AD|nr:hypothetical protein [Mammaliicoccus sp. Dog046]WQK85843.1 hypothetical protein P3U32_02055 [Mammaliicoccus sp. Dog046]